MLAEDLVLEPDLSAEDLDLDPDLFKKTSYWTDKQASRQTNLQGD